MFVKNGDQAILARLGEVKAGDVEFLLLIHGEGSGSETTRELMEDTGVECSSRVHNNSENTVLKRFCDVEDVSFTVHGEASGVGEASINDGLEHRDSEVNHEKTATRVL